MSTNAELYRAKVDKRDEFYTQLVDIEKEMAYYPDSFAGKIVYCNCDDPEWSNFWRYFHENFALLKLHKLISTHYVPGGRSYVFEYTGGNDSDILSGVRTDLAGDGDFRSHECVDILKQVDIIVTNGPFSLFRQYIAQLMEYHKKFLIIGNMNAVTYKEVFPLIQSGQVWLGASIHSGDREFRVPDDYELRAAGCRVDEFGRKYIRVKGVRWFTNLDYGMRHVPLDLTAKYDPAIYPRYLNSYAINIDRVSDIPGDYWGTMGVPITFLDKYCPGQFEIVGFRHGDDGKDLRYMLDGALKLPYIRILIRRRR